MEVLKIPFKSDFKVFLASKAGFSVPFRIAFYTNSPRLAYVACYDGREYRNCKLMEDGRLMVALDNHKLGLGKLMIQESYYLTDADYADGVCDEVIEPVPAVTQAENGEEHEIQLALSGTNGVELKVELPPHYQKGDPFRYEDFTPEQIEGLKKPAIDAAVVAENAAKEAENATEQAQKDHERAEGDHAVATSDHVTAVSDHTTAGSDHAVATGDHATAVIDHTTAGSDHAVATGDHATAVIDHTTAGSDHAVATGDHATAESDHERAEGDHAVATSDHVTAVSDHTTAGSDHAVATGDHATAESDHERAEGDHQQHIADHNDAIAQREAEDKVFKEKEAARDAANEAAMGAAEQLSQLALKVNGKIEKEFISVEFKSGGYYNSVINPELSTGTGVYCEGIGISNFRGKTICFEFSGMVSNSLRKSLLVDVNGNVISYKNENSAHDEGNGRYLLSFDIPSNAAKLYISTKQHTDGEVYVAEYQSGLNDKVVEIETELTVIAPSVVEKKDIKNCTFEYGRISHVTGADVSETDKSRIRTTDFFFCLKGTTIAKNISFPSNLRVYINVYSKADKKTFEEFIQDAQIGSVASYTFNKECFIRLDAYYIDDSEFANLDDVKDWIDLTTEETSLDKIERFSNKLENLSNVVYDKGYPDYFQKPLEEVISLVRKNNLLSGANGDSFIFATDLHYGNALGTSSLKNVGYTIQLAREIAAKTNNKLFICGGDILTDDHTKEEAMNIMRDFTNEAYNVFGQNYRFVSGNHDNNILKTLSEENRISDDELYAVCHKCFENNVVCYGKRYYYWDNLAQNIRYVVLAFNNITEKPIGKSQFDWLATTILSAPTGCRIVVIAHGLIDKFTGDTPTMTSHGEYVMNLLTSYNSRGNFNSPLGGTYNFDNAEGFVKIVIQGHTHIDKIVNDWSIPIVCTMNDSVPSVGSARIGTYREVVLDCIDLDFSNNKAYFIRLGEYNGQEREVVMA